MNARDEAMAKVEKLLKVTTANGATPAEEQTARRLAEALIAKHGLNEYSHSKTRGYDHIEFSTLTSEEMNAMVDALLNSFDKLAKAMAYVGKTLSEAMAKALEQTEKEAQQCQTTSTTPTITRSEASSASRPYERRLETTASSVTARATP